MQYLLDTCPGPVTVYTLRHCLPPQPRAGSYGAGTSTIKHASPASLSPLPAAGLACFCPTVLRAQHPLRPHQDSSLHHHPRSPEDTELHPTIVAASSARNLPCHAFHHRKGPPSFHILTKMCTEHPQWRTPLNLADVEPTFTYPSARRT